MRYGWKWASDLLPSKLKDESIKDISGSKNASSSMRQIILKVDYLRENYKCNTVLQCLCIYRKVSVGSQGRIGLCSLGSVWGELVLFVWVFLCFNVASEPLHPIIYLPPLDSSCPGHALSLLWSLHLSRLAREHHGITWREVTVGATLLSLSLSC